MTAPQIDVEDERDHGLVARHQAGDSEAFAELYARHAKRLRRFCRRLVQDPHLAEDIAQEAFLRAYTAVDRLDSGRRFYPWLTVIARRLVIDHVRTQARLRPEPHVPGGHTDAAEDVVVRRIQDDHVRTALGRVRVRHREVLRLRDWDDLSYDAIAAELGVTATAVPPLLHRARAALRREYLLSDGPRALLLHLVALWALVRRARDRVAAWSTWVPDMGAMAGPVAGAVLGVSSLFGLAQPEARPTLAQQWTAPAAVDAASAAHQAGTATTVRPVAETGGSPPAPSRAPVRELDAMYPKEGVRAGGYTIVGMSEEEARRRQEQSRHMPYYFEAGDAGFGADPDQARHDLTQWPPAVTPADWGWPPRPRRLHDTGVR